MKLPAEERKRRLEVRNGQRPVSELPPSYRDFLEHGRPLMERVLKTSRAEEAGPPDELRVFSSPTAPDEQSLMSFLSVSRLTALEVRLRLDREQRDSALELCLDGLALARDVGHGMGMPGAMCSQAVQRILFLPCSAAIQGASSTALRQAEKSLRRIREGLSPLSSSLHQESIVVALMGFGWTLAPEQVKQLPEGAQALVFQDNSPSELPMHSPAIPYVHAALIETFRAFQRMVPLMDMPPALRVPPLEAELHGLEHSWNSIVARRPPDFVASARRVDQQRAWMDLLWALTWVRTYRAEHGAWPSALPSLDPEHTVLLPTPLRLQPGPGEMLTLAPDEATLRELLKTDGDPTNPAWVPFELTASP